MALFGLLGKPGPEVARKRFLKGKQQLEKQEWNLARLTMEDVLEIESCPPEIRTAAEQVLQESCEKLARQNLEMARSHLEAGDVESAVDFFQTADRYAIHSETRAAAEKMRQELDSRMDNSSFIYGNEGEPLDEDLPEPDAYADILLEDYPAFIREAVDNDGELKSVMVLLNQEKPAEAESVMDMDESPAVLYFQALYLAEMDRIPEALTQYRKLVTEFGDQLDGLRWAEFIELVKRAEADEDIHEIVNQHPEMPVIRSALAFHMERNELEEAMDLVTMGMEIMSPTRPDAAFLAQAGLVHYQSGSYREAADMLDSFRNIMASRGQLALPTHLALPLADSLDKTGRTDLALETALHAAQAFGTEEAIRLSRELADRSTRDDLKKRVSRL